MATPRIPSARQRIGPSRGDDYFPKVTNFINSDMLPWFSRSEIKSRERVIEDEERNPSVMARYLATNSSLLSGFLGPPFRSSALTDLVNLRPSFK